MLDVIDRYHVPPGGWYARVGSFDIRGETYEELVRNVTDHVRNNGLEIGNEHRFVQDQISRRWPEGRIQREI